MRLTTKSEYSLLSLIYLARVKKTEEYIKIDVICEHYGLDKKYLQQIFNTLRTNGIIKTQSGKHGGYALAKKDNLVKVADIVRLMDGPLAPTKSVSKYYFSHNNFEKEEKLLLVLKDIRDYIANRLEHLSLKDLV